VNTEDLRKAVEDVIRTVAPECDPRRLQADRPLRRQLDLDSIDWLNVVAGLCDRLSIDIPERDYARLETVEAIVAYLASGETRAAGARPATPAPALPSGRHIVNGVAVCVRPIRPQDVSLEADFVRHLSVETRYKRFMTTLSELPPAKLRYFTDVDQVRHVALVATVERDGKEEIVGVVRYIVDAAGSSCEFAIAVADAWQGTGLAGILMQALIDVARARGVAKMEGVVLAANTRMLKFTRQLGFRQQRDPDDRDTVRVVRSL
jgi:GNAT superfamily N-acetyltransferase